MLQRPAGASSGRDGGKRLVVSPRDLRRRARKAAASRTAAPTTTAGATMRRWVIELYSADTAERSPTPAAVMAAMLRPAERDQSEPFAARGAAGMGTGRQPGPTATWGRLTVDTAGHKHSSAYRAPRCRARARHGGAGAGAGHHVGSQDRRPGLEPRVPGGRAGRPGGARPLRDTSRRQQGPTATLGDARVARGGGQQAGCRGPHSPPARAAGARELALIRCATERYIMREETLALAAARSLQRRAGARPVVPAALRATGHPPSPFHARVSV